MFQDANTSTNRTNVFLMFMSAYPHVDHYYQIQKIATNKLHNNEAYFTLGVIW